MKILQVITGIQKAAGTSAFSCEIASYLAEQGHTVTLAVVNPRCGDRYPLSPHVRLVSIDAVLSERSPDCDIVHLHTTWNWVMHRVSFWAARNHLSIVRSVHGSLAPWAMGHKYWKKVLPWYLYQRRDLAQAALFHATSEAEVQWYRNLGFNQPCALIPLGTILPPQVPARKHDKKAILFVGRIYPVKGLPNLLEAWAKLPSSVKQGWRIRLVGPDQAGHLEELRVLAGRLEIMDDIEFSGPLYGADLSRTYDDADLFVLPSYSENFGVVVLDALAHGLPVIASQGTPWQGLVANKCGWWVPIGAEPLAAQLVQSLALPPSELEVMGENGRRWIARDFTWGSIAKKSFVAYEWLYHGGDKPEWVKEV